MLVGVLLFFGGHIPAWLARRAAVRLLEEGAVSEARDWLTWSARFTASDGRRDVILARCYRYWLQNDRFNRALRSAEQNGAPPELIACESELGRISWGAMPEDPETRLATMVESGASSNDVCAAFVFGYLSQNDPGRAEGLLDRWAEASPDDVNQVYMRGIFGRSLGDFALARDGFQRAVEGQPRHELARTALAELLERQGELQQALVHRMDLAKRNRSSVAAILSLAGLLRKIGRAGDAQRVSASLALQANPSADVLWELGEISLQLGDYQEARRRFQESRMNQPGGYRPVLATAAAMALQGDQANAQTLFAAVESYGTAIALGGNGREGDQVIDQLNAVFDRLQLTNHLRERLAADPGDTSAARHLAALSAAPLVSPDGESNGVAPQSGPELYSRHCAVCHGSNGDGNGRAARHMYPRPKNLRTGGFRLISALNGAPSLKDLQATIRRGMPGSSMPPFDNLDEAEIEALAEEVLRLYSDGIREQLVASMLAEGEQIDENEIRETVRKLTTPGESAVIPPLGTITPQAVARGGEVYGRMGCVHCHGTDGSGPSDTLLVDDEGRLTSSRDLAREPLKGGEDPSAIYLRILLGMPGTPHPSCSGLTESEMADLVGFCLSLRNKPSHSMTNYERMIRATRPGG